MKDFSRRAMLKGGTAFAAAAALSGEALTNWAKAWAQASPWKPEAGAKVNLLRWRRFVEAEDVAFMKMVNAFKAATGVEVTVTNESFEDVQPKASVAANTGSGLDMVWGLYSLPHLFPQKCADLSDVADYLGKKYGGWTPSAELYGKSGGKWIGIPVATTGGLMNYRISSMEKAGFKEFPKDTAAFLELVKALKKNNTPAGFALGHASGDANTWLHWALWSHGGALVDKDDKVVINTPETVKALEYVKALYENFIPGTASWNDSSNNKAFVSGDLHLTSNGISVYVAAQKDNKAVAEDMNHAYMPIGPVGKPTELHLAFPILTFNFTKAPQACKAFTAFMLESENFNPWVEAAQGYLSHFLLAYDANPTWTADPKRTPFRDVSKRTLTPAGVGTLGEKAAAAIADFVVVDMFANFATGREDAKGAIAIAERQARRIYR
jgi:multiple sugar transport system substrate-binding protein